MKNIHSLLTVAQLEDIKLTFDGMFRVKAGRGYINWLNKLVYIIVKEKRSSLTRLSVVFIRDLWRIFPKKPKPLPYNIPTNAVTGIGFYMWDST
jgi:hypothetical protein